MIKAFTRMGIVFTLLLISNSLAESKTVGFDGGGPIPTCFPTPQNPCPNGGLQQ
jgi:hypothetical protein